MSDTPGFFARLALAFRILGDAALALVVQRAAGGEVLQAPAQLPAPAAAKPVAVVVEKPAPPVAVAPVAVAPIKPAPADDSAALHLLAILQRDGRLVDFLHENVSGFTDAEVGAAARLVHEGCKKALSTYVTVKPVRAEAEGARVKVEKGFDPAEVRLTGNVTGEPPFTGTLAHAGWRVVKLQLPTRPAGADASILAPAEVEL